MPSRFRSIARHLHQSEHSAARTTPRETEITRLLAEGKTNKEVAALLGIGVRTVETHRLREEITKLKVEINEEKSRKVDLSKGGSFGFLLSLA